VERDARLRLSEHWQGDVLRQAARVVSAALVRQGLAVFLLYLLGVSLLIGLICCVVTAWRESR